MVQGRHLIDSRRSPQTKEGFLICKNPDLFGGPKKEEEEEAWFDGWLHPQMATSHAGGFPSVVTHRRISSAFRKLRESGWLVGGYCLALLACLRR